MGVLRLGGWSPHIQTGFHVSRPTLEQQDDSTRTGLSPTLVRLSRLFRFPSCCYWPGPLSLATTQGVSVDVLSSGYLDVSVPRVCLLHLCIQCKILPKQWVSPFRNLRVKGCLPPHRSLSQATTSFIASSCQGIHRVRLVAWLYNPKLSHPPFVKRLKI